MMTVAMLLMVSGSVSGAEVPPPVSGNCGPWMDWSKYERWQHVGTGSATLSDCHATVFSNTGTFFFSSGCGTTSESPDQDADTDTGDHCSRTVASSCGSNSGIVIGASSSASIFNLDSDYSSSEEGTSRDQDCYTGCNNVGHVNADGSGIAVSAISWEAAIDGVANYNHTVTFQMTWDTGVDIPPCFPPPTCNGFNMARPMVTFVSEFVYRVNGTPQVKRGVIAINPDGTLERLGIFTHSDFDPTTTGTTSTINTSKTYTSTFGSANTVTNIEFEATVGESFTEFGDLNQDDQVCWSDLTAFDVIAGATISDSEYDPRVDFDLDGDNDGDDRTVLLNMVKCNADVNCDGDVGTDQDIAAFFAALGGGVQADFNGDGDVGTDQDIEAFFRVLGGGPC